MLPDRWGTGCGELGICEPADWLAFIGSQGVSTERATDCGPPAAPTDSSLPSGSHVEVLWQGCDSVVTLGVRPDGLVATWASTRPVAEVPDVVGLDEEQARTELREAGFAVEQSTGDTEPCYPDGKILGQGPGAGTSVPPGSTVTVLVNQESQDPAFCGGDPEAPTED